MVYLEQKTAQMFLKKFLVCSVILFGLFACNNPDESLPYYNTASFEPIFLKNNESVEKSIPHKIENFTLLNQDGVDFGSENLKGKIHVANFIFTSCTHICPKMTTNMTTVENEFLDDSELSLVSYTVTPWIDSPEILKRYKEEFTQNSNNWNFLTGKKAEIYSLARKSYFAEEEIGFTKDSTDFLHTEHFLLVDKSLRIRGIYNGTLGLEMEQLIKDINTLKK